MSIKSLQGRLVGFVGVSSRRWALKRESYENRSAVSVHVGQYMRKGHENCRLTGIH